MDSMLDAWGHNPNTLMVMSSNRAWIDGMVPLMEHHCICASCGAHVRKLTP